MVKYKLLLGVGIVLILFFMICGCEKKSITDNNTELFHEEEEQKIKQEHKKAEDPVNKKIQSMTLEEKVGQLFILGFEGCDDSEIKDLITLNHVGGVILYSRNITGVEQIKALTASMQEENPDKELELFIAVDEEGGRVNRMPEEIENFPSAREIGEKGDPEFAFANGNKIGKTIKELGFNMNFAPVLDVDSNPDNPVIGDRAYSSNVDTVLSMGIETYMGMKKAGVIAVGKHFPGHGDTDIDSHKNTPIIKKTRNELENMEFIPFKRAIEADIPAIMVSHLLVSAIDSDNVASVSTLIINDILRQEYKFNGLIISDDMAMGGVINCNTMEEAVVKNIKAGGDIVIISGDKDKQRECIEKVIEAVKSGDILEERLNESLYRIINVKSKM